MEEALPVTLIVKAPNQQVADQTVRCHPHWTIRKLKGHLSEVYPCKPKSEEQKLIYSGQLLSDTVVLKDVLRKYEGQDTHTVHLVCTSPQAKYGYPSTPKSASTTTTTTNTTTTSNETSPNESQQNSNTNNSNVSSNVDGLRHRNVGESSPPEIRPENASNTNNQNVPNPFLYNPYTSYYWNQEQAEAWTRQMNQWAASGYNAYAPGNAMPNIPNMDPMMFAAQVAWMQRMQQMQQYYVGNIPGAQGYPADPVPGLNPEQVFGNVQDNPDAQQPANQQDPANANNDGIDVDANDWLDWLYNFSRLLLMAAIVYFYSSPMRFLIVLVLATTIYLFQSGFFNQRINNINNRNGQRQNHADNINNNYQPADNNNDQVQNNVAESDVSNRDNNTNNNQPVNEDSFLTITWTAFTSFFTSLIPETPNAIRN